MMNGWRWEAMTPRLLSGAGVSACTHVPNLVNRQYGLAAKGLVSEPLCPREQNG